MAKIFSALLLLVAIPACSDSGIALSDLPAAAADAVCTGQARCGEMPDVASCKAARANDIEQLLADVSVGRIKYDGKAAAACLDVFRSASCNYSDQRGLEEPQACKDTFKGTVADSGPCYSGSECASGNGCSGGGCSDGSACCPGKCNPGPSSGAAIAIGGDCSGLGAVCVSGAFCSYGLTAICTAKAAAGQSCDTLYAGSSCADGAYCVANGPNTGICGKLPAQGQSCYPTAFAYIPACDSMLDYCDSATLKCVPKIAVGGDCSGGASCVGYATCDATGHCVAHPGAGDVCDDANGPRCLGSLQCSSGTCALPPATPVCQ
ncbi:MAG TPA: hypothetical protein VJ860_23025 [Polyangia bacterium]|jgi:hypothetical protein|nr:hypothetical protein [Polyangia bacterium]